jgi:UDP-glucose 4-epimerase
MKNPTIAILGVSGQLGQALARELQENSSIGRFVGIDKSPPPESHASMEFYQADISSADLSKVFLKERVSHVAHLAFALAPNHDRKKTMFNNVQGTANVLSAVNESRVDNFLFCSSVNVYGAHPDHPGPLPETTRPRPDSGIQYSLDKMQAEALCSKFQADHPRARISIIRPVTIVGPDMNNFISRFLEKPVLIAPRGYDPPFQYVHEIDVARAILALLLGDHSGVFNLGGDDWTRLSEVLKKTGRPVVRIPRLLLKLTTALAWQLRLTSLTEIPPALIDYLCFPPIVDNNKIKREVGFSFAYKSSEAIEVLIRRSDSK